jgi:hypothetical protein
LRSQSTSLIEQENKIDTQLAMSNPLLSEILEFFQTNEEHFRAEENLENMVSQLQGSLEECLTAENEFEKAAHYNPFDRKVEGGLVNYSDRKKINFK